MITTIIVLLITFILTIIDKFFLTNQTKVNNKKIKHGFVYRLIKSKYTLLILLLGLLIFQTIEVFRTTKTDKIRDETASKTHAKVSQTYNEVLETNSAIKLLLNNIDSTLKITIDELSLISNVNEDIKNVRNEIEKNRSEYNSIKSQYNKQIEIEKEIIAKEKPYLKVIFAMSIIDSLSFAYQFQLENTGIRIADSIVYHSIMIFIDYDTLFNKANLYRTNVDDANVISLVGEGNTYIVNSKNISRKELIPCKFAFLLIKFRYVDILTLKPDSSFNILQCNSLDIDSLHYSFKVDKQNIEIIKSEFFLNNKKYYKIFFNE